jgi:hypothetical protein
MYKDRIKETKRPKKEIQRASIKDNHEEMRRDLNLPWRPSSESWSVLLRTVVPKQLNTMRQVTFESTTSWMLIAPASILVLVGERVGAPVVGVGVFTLGDRLTGASVFAYES